MVLSRKRRTMAVPAVDWSASERQTRAVAELLTGPDDAGAETDPRPPK
jgi:hypothetical protein